MYERSDISLCDKEYPIEITLRCNLRGTEKVAVKQWKYRDQNIWGRNKDMTIRMSVGKDEVSHLWVHSRWGEARLECKAMDRWLIRAEPVPKRLNTRIGSGSPPLPVSIILAFYLLASTTLISIVLNVQTWSTSESSFVRWCMLPARSDTLARACVNLHTLLPTSTRLQHDLCFTPPYLRICSHFLLVLWRFPLLVSDLASPQPSSARWHSSLRLTQRYPDRWLGIRSSDGQC